MCRERINRLGRASVLWALAATACAVSFNQGVVTHTVGRETFTGHSVDLGDATPAPGTRLVEGTTLRLSIRVRYSLMSAREGRIILFFKDGSGNRVLKGSEVAVHIERTGRREEITLSRDITVPAKIRDLVVCIGVYPRQSTETSGALLIRYPVFPPPDKG